MNSTTATDQPAAVRPAGDRTGRAAALRAQAAALVGRVPDVRLARMAATDAALWDDTQVAWGERIVADAHQWLATQPTPTPGGAPPAGWVPAPAAAAPTPEPAQPDPALASPTTAPAGWNPTPAGDTPRPDRPAPVAVRHDPLLYDGTIDGLRGVPVGELDAVGTQGRMVGGKYRESQQERFGQFGVETVYDLLTHIPLRYVRRDEITPMSALRDGDKKVTVVGVVTSINSRPPKNGKGKPIVRIEVSDRTQTVTCTFFNQPWLRHKYSHGDEVILTGDVTVWISQSGRGFPQMSSPMIDRTGSNSMPILPVYPQSGKSEVTTWEIHQAAREAVARLGTLTDPVPAAVGRPLMARQDAYQQIHLPDVYGNQDAARERLAYDELLRMQLALQMRRLAEAAKGGQVNIPTGHLTGTYLSALPYQLTGAQQRALATIADGLRAPTPLHALLQGDVGAGKTSVAFLTLLMGVEAGRQGALMAPTEILATQLFDGLAEAVADLTKPDGRPVRVAALTSGVRTRARRDTLAELADGTIDILVGTHALLVDDVTFSNLGVVVIDEQHRFGVEQRTALAAKASGGQPDMLVMTATPIPRTAAMTVFGDLDTIVLDELPPGRTPIDTTWVPYLPDPTNPTDPVWAQIRQQVAEGRQAYVVCPLVEDSETKAAASATHIADQLAAGALAGLRVGLVHGKLKPADKTDVMDRFAAGALDVLVATTVIEVGVNVPNASTIVILEPKSFGIAQLHQLRGRVGRGRWASSCILAGEAFGDSEKRMEALVSTTNGFVLADVDLQLRGPGSILGSKQSGLSDLRVASLTTDTAILDQARADAATILAADPALTRHPVLRNEVANALGPNADHYLTAT